VIGKIADNLRAAFREILESALAASLAWWIGLQLLGDRQPLFAAIVAVVCLSPGLPSHSKQALGMFIGVVTGIAVGEILLLTAPGPSPLVIGVGMFAAMIAATAFRVQPVVGIQAGISAAIVFVDGEEINSFLRAADAVIGGLVALLFSQVLFTPNPFDRIRRGAEELLDTVEQHRDGFDRCRANGDRGALRDLFDGLRDAEQAFAERLQYADQIADRTMRGRLKRQEIKQATREWRRLARELHLALGSVGFTLEHGTDDEIEQECPRQLGEANRLIDEAKDRLERCP
jgi:uncharacterized membrane protein YgaE (UPF0421/DUF939 family)